MQVHLGLPWIVVPVPTRGQSESLFIVQRKREKKVTRGKKNPPNGDHSGRRVGGGGYCVLGVGADGGSGEILLRCGESNRDNFASFLGAHHKKKKTKGEVWWDWSSCCGINLGQPPAASLSPSPAQVPSSKKAGRKR